MHVTHACIACPEACHLVATFVRHGRSMKDRFERHKQPWTAAEIDKLHTLAKKGMALKAIAKALTRSEESVKIRAKTDGLSIAKLR